MKRKNSLLLLTALILTSAFVLSSCSSVVDVGVVDLQYYDNEGETGYNEELYYRNDLDVKGADPGCIYVTEGEYEGYYFLYGTNDQLNTRGYLSYKSKDLSNWEMESVCFTPEDAAWGRTGLWAPEVFYDKEDGKYYLFYCATNTNQADGYANTKYIGVAVSDSPAGPFVQYTGVNGNGTEIDLGTPLIDVELLGKEHPLYKEGTGYIDPHPFVDPQTGDKYLFFVRTRAAHDSNIIVGLKMKDWVTPDYSSYTELTTVNRTTYGGSIPTERSEGEINEAPQVLFHEGTYYLTCSINATTDKDYGIIQALSESPLGPYTKVQSSAGGLVASADVLWDHISCVGSHAFVSNGEENWLVYHQNVDREAGGTMDRAYAADRYVFVENALGQKLIKAVGPTYSIQPKPSAVTGYKNLASNAEISVTGMVEGSSADYLTDGAVRIHSEDIIEQFEGEGTVTITMNFDEYVTAKSLLIYNSCFYEDAFYEIASIDFSFRKMEDGKEYVGVARAEKLYYDFEQYSSISYEIMRPGAPMIIEFDELEINSVTITLSCPVGQEIVAINEIILLGKEGSK